MKRLLEFFQESSGQLSSTRLCFILWTLMITVVYAVRAIKGLPEPLPQSWDVMALTAMLGGLKFFQKGQEMKVELADAKTELVEAKTELKEANAAS